MTDQQLIPHHPSHQHRTGQPAKTPRGRQAALCPRGGKDADEAATQTSRTGEFAVSISRHPVILATIVRHILTGSLEGARQGYRVARTELGEAVPPHAVDAALTAYRDEGRRLAATVKAAELVERALRSEPF